MSIILKKRSLPAYVRAGGQTRKKSPVLPPQIYQEANILLLLENNNR
jgi:hypothetical protein